MRAALTEYLKLGGLKQQDFFSPSSCKSLKIKVLAVLVPSEGSEEEISPITVAQLLVLTGHL